MNTEKQKHSNKTEFLSGTIVLCLAVILLTILFPRLYNSYDGLEKITATVTAVNKRDSGEISETSFTYNYLNKEYNGISADIKNSYVGEKLEIYVDPELPTSVIFPNDLSRLLVILRLLSISIIAIAVFLLLKSKSKEIFT